jgi:hypothetical protein
MPFPSGKQTPRNMTTKIHIEARDLSTNYNQLKGGNLIDRHKKDISYSKELNTAKCQQLQSHYRKTSVHILIEMDFQ